MPVLFVLALAAGVVAGALMTPAGEPAADPRTTVALTVVGLVLASFAAVLAAAREATGELLLDRPLDDGTDASPAPACTDGSAVRDRAPDILARTSVPVTDEPARASRHLDPDRTSANGFDHRTATKLATGPSQAGIPPDPPKDGDEAPRPRTAPVLRLPGLRACHRRWLAPTLAADSDDAAFAAWLDSVLRERDRLAWRNAAVGLFVPLPASALARPTWADELHRRLEEETGIDAELVLELEADGLPPAPAELQPWVSIPRTSVALRVHPLAPVDPSHPPAVGRILVDADALLRAADDPARGSAAVSDWIARVLEQEREPVAVGVRDPRIVPRLAGLGVRFATGPGLAATRWPSGAGAEPAAEAARSQGLGKAPSTGPTSIGSPTARRPDPTAPAADAEPGPDAVAGCAPAVPPCGPEGGAPSPLAALLAAAGRRAAAEPLRAATDGAGGGPEPVAGTRSMPQRVDL